MEKSCVERAGVRTCVLYLCHVINDETVFRFNHLKRGCDSLGYDLVWVLDSLNYVGKLPDGVDFFTCSLNSFMRDMPFAVFHADWRTNYANATPGMVLQFHSHHMGKYDRLWVIEYDSCVFGSWADFFTKYESDDADFVTADIRPHECGKNWMWFRTNMPPEFFEWIRDNLPLHMSLNCCCRLSSRLFEDICSFYKTISRGSKFFEWVWITVAKRSGYKTRCIESNHLNNMGISAGFTDFRPGVPYHAVKLDISWKDVLSRAQRQSGET